MENFPRRSKNNNQEGTRKGCVTLKPAIYKYPNKSPKEERLKLCLFKLFPRPPPSFQSQNLVGFSCPLFQCKITHT